MICLEHKNPYYSHIIEIMGKLFQITKSRLSLNIIKILELYCFWREINTTYVSMLIYGKENGGCIHVNGQICYVKIELYVLCYSVNILLWKWGCFDGIKGD